MSSKSGPRAAGTDGKDFLKREVIANHYYISATYKYWLKVLIFFHFALVLLMMFRLSTSIYVMFGIRPPHFLQVLKLPIAQGWEYAWSFSGVASLFGLFALPRNRLFLIKQYFLGTLVFGLGPALFAVFSLLDDLLDFYETRETKKLFLGFPVIVLWNMFLFVALQVHGFGLYFSWKLIAAWKPKQKKVN